jgi:outer membrane protein, multidrug efflux system
MRHTRRHVAPRTTRAFGAVLLAGIVSGCATAAVGHLQSAATPPTSWSSTGDGIVSGSAEDLSRWWERLGDEELSSLIDRALIGSVDLRIAHARLQQARAQWKVTGADRAVSVTASASPSVSDTSRSETRSLFSAGIDAGWEPDVFGAKARASDAAAADMAATEADLHNTQVSLTAEVALNYVELRQLQARLDIVRQNLASQTETFQLTTWRAQAGLVTELDVAQARANRDQTAAQVPSLETSIAEAEHRLAVLIGIAPGSLAAELSARAAVPAAPDQIVVGIPAETLRQRPDVRAAEQRVVAETARTARAAAAKYPSFNLAGSLGLNIATGGVTALESLAGSVFQTLFDGGRIREQISVQTAVQEQAVLDYESIVLAALEDVENALVTFSNSRSRLAALDSAAGAAREAASLAQSRYQAGLTDFQSVLDTQRTLLSVQDSLVSSQADRTLAVIRLYKALGGGWSPASTLAVTAQEGRKS